MKFNLPPNLSSSPSIVDHTIHNTIVEKVKKCINYDILYYLLSNNTSLDESNFFLLLHPQDQKHSQFLEEEKKQADK